jgi:DegV family protein with EDD domain
MATVRVVTDSTADLPPAALDRYRIVQVPLLVNWEGKSYRDKVELSTAQFYEKLRQSRSMPQTSAPSLGAFEEVYRELLAEADHVISVHLASKLSATFSVAKSAAENVAPERITVIDSDTLTMCLGWMAVRAAELAEAGASVYEIVASLRDMIPRLVIYAALDTLEFLERGGRIGKAQALLGTVLQFKPIITVKAGEVRPLERVRTRPAAVRRLAEIATSQPLEQLGVLHGAAPESADALAAEIQRLRPELRIDRAEIGAVIGTHAGPGVFGTACLLAR